MTREDVIAETRTWLGTRYHSHARLKGIGVDCAQLPAAVYHACGLIPELKPTYDAQWFMHRDEEKYLEWVRPHAREIEPDAARPGDFLIWKWGRTYSHGGILVTPENVIHAQAPHGVIETNWRQDSYLSNSAEHPCKAFTVWSD